jgi:hypothetical protein
MSWLGMMPDLGANGTMLSPLQWDFSVAQGLPAPGGPIKIEFQLLADPR